MRKKEPGAKVERGNKEIMSSIQFFLKLSFVSQVPNANGTVIGAGQQKLPGRVYSNVPNPVVVCLVEVQHALECRNAPNAERSITTSGNKVTTTLAGKEKSGHHGVGS